MSRALDARLRKLEPRQPAGSRGLSDEELTTRLEAATTAALAECGSMGGLVASSANDPRLTIGLAGFVRRLAADPRGIGEAAATYRASGAPVFAELIEAWHDRHV